MARQFSTVIEFIQYGKVNSNTFGAGVIEFEGFNSIGDGGATLWQREGTTGLTPSKTPTEFDDNRFTDAVGDLWVLVPSQIITFNGVQFLPSPFGDAGNGGYYFNGAEFVFLASAADEAAAAAASAAAAQVSAQRAEDAAASIEGQLTTAQLIASSLTIDVGETIETNGFYTAGDGGGALWIKTDDTDGSSQTPADIGDAKITDSLGNVWDLVVVGDLRVRSLGGFPENDSKQVLLAAANFVKGTYKRIVVSDNLVSSDDQKGFADCIFIGDGSIDGIYRKNVFKESQNKTSYLISTFTDNQVAKTSVENPTVVLMGDSISTYNANSLTRSGMLTDVLEMQLKREFGDLYYFNRAIGGQTFNSANSTPPESVTGGVEWYSDQSKPWLDYIEELNPDVVVLSFGMNDSMSISSSEMEDVVNKIKSFNSSPSIVMATNLTPSLSGNKSGLFATKEEQEGRDYAAGYIRTFAEYFGLGLIDINRLGNIVRDGLDVVDGIIGDRETVNANNNTIQSGKSCYNFKASIVFNESLMVDDSNVYIDVPLGTDNTKVRLRNFGGNYRVISQSGSFSGTATNHDIVDTSESVGSGEGTINIEITGSKVTLYRNDVSLGANTDPMATFNIIRGGGMITPRILTNDDGKLVRATFDTSFNYLSMPTCKDSDLWGSLEQAGSVDKWGGSGWNHPSSFAGVFIYSPLLQSCRFKGSGTASSRDVITSQSDRTTGRVLTTGAGGLLGSAVTIPSADSAHLGVFCTSGQLTNAEAVSAGFPDLGVSDSTLTWWNVQTYGVGNRQTQIATQIFASGAGRQNATYTRVKQDSSWSEWIVNYTSSNVNFNTFGGEAGKVVADVIQVTSDSIRFSLYINLPTGRAPGAAVSGTFAVHNVGGGTALLSGLTPTVQGSSSSSRVLNMELLVSNSLTLPLQIRAESSDSIIEVL